MAALAAVLLLAVTPAADAGQYHVYSCRMPSGVAAPTDGWAGSKSGTYTYAKDTCGEPGGALIAALGDQPVRAANTDWSAWAFTLPPGGTLAGVTLWRAGDADGGSGLDASYQFWEAAPTEHDVFDQCVNGLGCTSEGSIGVPLSDANRLVVPAAKVGPHIYVKASCGGAAEYECPAGQGDANNYAAAVYLYAADLTLEQTAGPSVSGVGGELAGAPAVAGTSDLAFTATDPGSGVYEAVVSVDGSVVQTTVLNEEGGRCRNVGQTNDGLPAFLYLQPCPSSVSSDLGFDTTGLSNGPHHLVVSVLDAAGNAAPVLDRTITIANPGALGPPNGQGASPEALLSARWQSTTKTRLTTAYGRRETIIGRLTSAGGGPISGAQLDVTQTPAMAGAAGSATRGTQTGPDGGFVLRLPAGLSSRTVHLSYAARLGDPHPAATATLQLAVKAPVSLTIAPRKASVGRTIRFRGRLAAGPIPRGGKSLVLEARSGRGHWIEFHVIRTDAHGRYRSTYRFKFPGPATYQFRVLCEQDADYPYVRSSSRVVTVKER